MCNTYKLAAIVLFAVVLAGCSDLHVQLAQPHSAIWQVKVVGDNCLAQHNGHCLQVRADEQKPWRNFTSPIEGLNCEMGMLYRIRLAISPNQDPIGDEAGTRYTLLDILEKTPLESQP